MSALTELHDKLTAGIENAEGWFDEIKGHLPAVAEIAAKYNASPIVQALENAVLPPNVEAEIAKLITELGNVGQAATTAPTTPASTDTATTSTTAA